MPLRLANIPSSSLLSGIYLGEVLIISGDLFPLVFFMPGFPPFFFFPTFHSCLTPPQGMMMAEPTLLFTCRTPFASLVVYTPAALHFPLRFEPAITALLNDFMHPR